MAFAKVWRAQSQYNSCASAAGQGMLDKALCAKVGLGCSTDECLDDASVFTHAQKQISRIGRGATDEGYVHSAHEGSFTLYIKGLFVMQLLVQLLMVGSGVYVEGMYNLSF
ncbi:hypothetical protein VNO80_01753 [Phaseolus coccineus]|uniref:Uncharacterized protein n=1 Tax=Phaseolus coccineus TaxID=3886 RepID=A0AAN9WXF8_PHACN